ncbi:alpha/beta fold hydrolase [Achromobacter seleniivolatilans]|uniref:Alpha/beta fold hydrolase n=1 Tax=Achromobacter seleniivolatilans TaxID=3047478 RepID=A0ABY9LUQ7_9BURK|nr:alpha/beta fold hydrolase [Achromobacter sp. R39]WMD18502.1 alpha/beta fold hydrolase [Achromobacter sp. R39]
MIDLRFQRDAHAGALHAGGRATNPQRTGALLIHGLGGTEFDMGSLHKVLARAGVETHGVTLPGHAGQPEDLLNVGVEDWMEVVTRRYRELCEQYDVLHVIGMCLGALLAVELCKRESHTRGALVSLAAPVFLDGWSTPWYRGLRYLLYCVPGVPRRIRVQEEDPYGVKSELVRAFIKAGFARGDGFHYQWVPLACVRQVDRLRGVVQRGLDRIRCPTLIMHAEEDELTSPRSARFLGARIPGATVVMLQDSYHMICVDHERDRVMRSVLAFLGKDPAFARTRKRPAAEQALRENHPLPAPAILPALGQSCLS